MPHPLRDGPMFKSITYITKSPYWFPKLCLGGLLAAIPFVAALADGYQIEVIKNLRADQTAALPSWKFVGRYLRQGIKFRAAVWAIYAVPFLIGLLISAAEFYPAMRALISGLCRILGIDPFGLANPEPSFAIISLGILGNYLVVPFLSLATFLALVILFFSVPALARRIADGDSFLSLFDPFRTFSLIFRNFWRYLGARLSVLLLLIVFGMIAGIPASIGFFTVIAPTLAWLILCFGRFLARLVWAYRLAHLTSPETELDPVTDAAGNIVSVNGRWHSPALATTAAVLVPGAGQAYNGQPVRGVFVLFLTPFVLPYLAGIWQANTTAGRIARRGGRTGRGGWMWIVLQLWLAANVAFFIAIFITGIRIFT
jgi:hypothetical protein